MLVSRFLETKSSRKLGIKKIVPMIDKYSRHNSVNGKECLGTGLVYFQSSESRCNDPR